MSSGDAAGEALLCQLPKSLVLNPHPQPAGGRCHCSWFCRAGDHPRVPDQLLLSLCLPCSASGLGEACVHVHMHIHMCINMHLHMCAHMCACGHVYTCVYVCPHGRGCVRSCTCSVHTSMCTHIYTCTHMHACTHVPVCTRAHVHMRTFACFHMCTCVCTCVHMCILCMCLQVCVPVCV